MLTKRGVGCRWFGEMIKTSARFVCSFDCSMILNWTFSVDLNMEISVAKRERCADETGGGASGCDKYILPGLSTFRVGK